MLRRIRLLTGFLRVVIGHLGHSPGCANLPFLSGVLCSGLPGVARYFNWGGILFGVEPGSDRSPSWAEVLWLTTEIRLFGGGRGKFAGPSRMTYTPDVWDQKMSGERRIAFRYGTGNRGAIEDDGYGF